MFEPKHFDRSRLKRVTSPGLRHNSNQRYVATVTIVLIMFSIVDIVMTLFSQPAQLHFYQSMVMIFRGFVA